MVSRAQDVAGRLVEALGWSGRVRSVPDGERVRLVHETQGWWLALVVHEDAGAAQVLTGRVAPDGSWGEPSVRSMGVPVEDIEALAVLAVTALNDADGAAVWSRQRLDVTGMVWISYDGGLSRLPVACGRCGARSGHRLTVDQVAGLATLRCTAGHVTRDPRLSCDSIVEAIARADAPRVPGDLYLPGTATR